MTWTELRLAKYRVEATASTGISLAAVPLNLDVEGQYMGR
jgi:hypothetical protein